MALEANRSFGILRAKLLSLVWTVRPRQGRSWGCSPGVPMPSFRGGVVASWPLPLPCHIPTVHRAASGACRTGVGSRCCFAPRPPAAPISAGRKPNSDAALSPPAATPLQPHGPPGLGEPQGLCTCFLVGPVQVLAWAPCTMPLSECHLLTYNWGSSHTPQPPEKMGGDCVPPPSSWGSSLQPGLQRSRSLLACDPWDSQILMCPRGSWRRSASLTHLAEPGPAPRHSWLLY